MKIQLPYKVNMIINKLIECGFEAYAVGGCVRDSILGKEPEDWDITTSANPYEVKDIFRRTIDTGIKHGTVTVMIEKDGYEVTTYRIDGEYEDNRHPKEVEFTRDLTEDLKRRDFTINAMAYNEQNGLVDVFHGYEDLKSGIIRCVGSARDRFDEDALRILRAIRFSAQLGFEIDPDTLMAVEEKANNLNNISAERIRVELCKLLLSDNPDKLIVAYETGITKVILPEFDKTMITEQKNPHHLYNVGDHTIKAISSVCSGNIEKTFTSKEKLILKLTMLLHDIEKPNFKTIDNMGVEHFYGHDKKGAETAKQILRRLKFDNESIQLVHRLVLWHDYRFELEQVAMRRAMYIIGSDIMELLFEVKRADTLAQNPSTHEEKFKQLEIAKELYNTIINNNECVSLKQLDINGKDLIDLGYKPGVKVGETLDKLLSIVIEDPSKNKKEILIKIAADFLV